MHGHHASSSPRSDSRPGRARVAQAALLLCLAALVAACASRPSLPSEEETRAEIRAFVEEFNKAYESNDLEKYWSFYAPEMTQFYPQGRLDLADYQAYWNKHVGEGNRLQEVRLEDMVIHVGPSRDAAAVHYRVFIRTSHPDGTTAEEWAQESDSLVKRDGAWKVVHMHYSYPAKESPATAPAAGP